MTMKRTLEGRTSWAWLSGSLAALGLAILCGALAGGEAGNDPAPPVKPEQPDKAAKADKPATEEKAGKDDKTAAAEKPAQAQPDTIGDREEVIVIGNVPTPGRPILPATETEFRWKLSATGDVVTLRWADLPEMDRSRVQKIFGLVLGENGKPVFGDKITALRITTKAGKTIEGLPIPEPTSEVGRVTIAA